jgi:hypothetical protein
MLENDGLADKSSLSSTLSAMIPSNETEVFRLTRFSKDKAYEFALYTTKIGSFPNNKYYANTNSLQYLGYWVSSERWNSLCDGSGGAENFVNNGIINRIEYDYEGRTCFVETYCMNPPLLESDHVQKDTDFS